MAGKPWEKYQKTVPDTVVAPAGVGPWTKYQQPTDVAPVGSQEPQTSAAEAALQAFGQGGTFGYLPEIQAGVGHAAESTAEYFGGPPATDYEDLKAYFKKQNELKKTEHPIASIVGNIAGAVGTMPLGGMLVRGAGTIPTVAKGAETAYGAAKSIPFLGKFLGAEKAIQGTEPALQLAGHTGVATREVAPLALEAGTEIAPDLLSAGQTIKIPFNKNIVSRVVGEAPVASEGAGALQQIVKGGASGAEVIGGDLAVAQKVAQEAAQAQKAAQAAETIAPELAKQSLKYKLGKAMTGGALYGAAVNPESEGDAYDELKARLHNAVIGGALGAGGESLVGGIGTGLTKMGEKLSKTAIIKQIGANAGQIKKILLKGELPKIEGFMSKEGLMKPGNSIETVAEKTAKIIEDDGPKIGKLYEDAQAAAKAVHEKVKTSNEIPLHYDKTTGGFKTLDKINGNSLADEIVSTVKAASKNHPDRNLVNKTIDDAVAPLRDMGDNANIVDLHQFRQGLDENINWGQVSKERDAVQRAYIKARNMVVDKTKNTIDALDKTLGGNKLKELKDLNERFSVASTVNKISTQGQGREMAKVLMGHGVVSGGAGLTAAGLEYSRSHDPLKAAAAGAATAIGVTAARKYGAPIGFYGGKAISTVGKGINKVTPSSQNIGAGLASPWFNMGSK